MLLFIAGLKESLLALFQRYDDSSMKWHTLALKETEDGKGDGRVIMRVNNLIIDQPAHTGSSRPVFLRRLLMRRFRHSAAGCQLLRDGARFCARSRVLLHGAGES